MRFQFLNPSESREVEYHSSVMQKHDALSVWAGGMWMPVVFDKILGIDCERVISRRVYVGGKDDLGYDYPIGEFRYTTDTYSMFDRSTETVEVLPEWFGSGFYKKYNRDSLLTNFDNGSLGVRNNHLLRLGMSYAKAKKTLPPVE